MELSKIEDSLKESANVLENCNQISHEISQSIVKIIKSMKNGKKIILFGNGGSAADSQHIAAELIGRFRHERQGIPAISLTTDTSILTSLSNDYSYDVVFSRQCESLVSKDDIAFGISTSGNSKNVENGLKTAKQLGAITIGLLGNNGGCIKDIVDIAIIVPSTITSHIQEAHRVIYHIICAEIEEAFID
jgi:D-sedoheptulose 7-phosphate isomerase